MLACCHWCWVSVLQLNIVPPIFLASSRSAPVPSLRIVLVLCGVAQSFVIVVHPLTTLLNHFWCSAPTCSCSCCRTNCRFNPLCLRHLGEKSWIANISANGTVFVADKHLLPPASVWCALRSGARTLKSKYLIDRAMFVFGLDVL